MKRIIIISLLFSLVTVCEAQSRYCMTYEDFVKGIWVTVDTFSVTKLYGIGGNNYKVRSKEKDVKNAFVIAQDDSMYVNCRHLRYQKTKFGSGYVKAWKIGTRSVLFVNKLIGQEARKEQAMAGVLFGIIGSAVVANEAKKCQVCYVISSGADEKGRIDIRLIDDDLIKQMLDEQAPSLLKEYFAESDWKKRIGASRVFPILEKSGLIRIN